MAEDILKRINEILEQGIKATGIDADPTDTSKYGFAPEHGSVIRELEELELLDELVELVGGEDELGELIYAIAKKQEEVSPRYQTQDFQNFDLEGQPIGKRAYGITTAELQQKEIQDVIKNFIDTPTNVVDEIKLSGTMGGNTTPTGVNIAYADVNELDQFVQFDRRQGGDTAQIDAIKQTIRDKGYLHDTAYDGGVVFAVVVDESGNVQIIEGNHRLRALIELSQETGEQIYVPINPVMDDTSGGNKVKLTDTDTAFNSMKQLLTDMLENDKNFNVERTISEKLGEPGRKIVGLTSYTYPGGQPGTSTNQNNIKKFFNSIGINAITYDELPDDNVYKSGTNQFTDNLPLLETRMDVAKQDSMEWADDVIKPNKVFNPDALTRLETQIDTSSDAAKKLAMGQEVDMQLEGKYIWTRTRDFDAKEMYRRIVNGRASDEDITKFFIYLASHSPQSAYANNPFNRKHAIADIVKIGIFSDIPLTDVIPMGVYRQEAIFLDELQNMNSEIGDEINKVLVELVTEQGQFYDLRERMRKVILDAHKKIYANNPNDYFILWRGGDLNRFHPWQSFSKSNLSATGVMYQMVQAGFGGGRKVESYVIHKNNMIDLDALGLSHMDEMEVIVLTEEAKSPLSLRQKIETPSDIGRIKDWWLTARTETSAFPKDGMKITNISQPLTDAGQSTQQFFNTVIEGGDPRFMPKTAYNQLIDLNNSQIYKFQDDYNKFIAEGGNFNQHIFTSIPTFYETQVVKMAALSFLINNNPLPAVEFGGPAQPYRILDIGGTEGAWAKALAKNNPLVEIEVLDPSAQAKDIFDNRNLVTNAKFTQEAFSHKPEDQGKFFQETGGKPIKFTDYTKFEPMSKYDIIHESMAFQFMDNDRAGQIKFIKENLLNNDGVLIVEEKFLDDNKAIYDANETKKDFFKRQYYTEEQLNNKKLNVLLNMEGKQVSVQEIQKILGENFANVEQYWDAGNFKGFIASDSPVIESFKTGMQELDVSLTNHQYSTSPTNAELKASINKITYNHGTDKKLAGQIAEETVAKNPKFFNSIGRAMARLGIAGGAALSAVSRVAPYLAPGDLAIERAIEKAVPYLDDAAARLGFGRISFGQILPTYIAYEIGVAAADTVQAAMYAYDASQEKAPQQPGKFQTTLTKILLPKALEEEAIKKSQIPGDLQAFYNTPTGQKVVEELDFGSQFMRELDKETISKYSPGWGLTKGLLTLLSTPSEKSDYNYLEKYQVSR